MKRLVSYLGAACLMILVFNNRALADNTETNAEQPRIRQGDILTEVNGIPVDTPENGLAAFQKLNKESNARVKVERDSESTSARDLDERE